MSLSILIHDYAGHPFQVELSRALAKSGHRVCHAYFAADSGPKGTMQVQDGDSDTLSFHPVGAKIPYSKNNFIKRRAGDIAYGKELATYIRKIKPDVVISGNTPTEAARPLPAAAHSVEAAFVYWVQDLFGLATKRILSRKIPLLGALVGNYYQYLDQKALGASDHIVLITEAFYEQTDLMRISRDRITVIPNWGAIDEIDVLSRNTDWAKEQQLPDGLRFLYSGTLALKHNPELLVALSKAITERGEVILVSAGVGAEMLMTKTDELPGLRCLPLQPFEVFPAVLGSADVLLAVIEREAGAFSVPSKILSYLCAGRPIVLAAPQTNLAAKMLRESGAGLVVEPEDVDGFVEAALYFARTPEEAAAAGLAGRQYAEQNFQIENVADKFEAVFSRTISHRNET